MTRIQTINSLTSMGIVTAWGATIAMLVLKLGGVISVSWLTVSAPVLVPFLLIFISGAIVLPVILLTYIYKKMTGQRPPMPKTSW